MWWGATPFGAIRNYHGGQYYDHEHGPEVGLAVARMIGHITYLSPEAMMRKFDADRMHPHDVATEFEKVFSVGSYLGYQGTKFVERFDANSYIALTMAMDLFDLGSTQVELAKACPACCRWLIMSFSSDWLFPPEQSRDIVRALISANAPVSYCNIQSSCGHDAFLLPDDFPTFGEMIRAFLANLAPQPAGSLSLQALADKQTHAPTSIFHQRRLDYDRIVELVEPGASVLDLGCGSGRLLARLKRKDHRRLVGVELDEQKILACVCRGLDVIQSDLNKGLRAFADQQFDCVVLSQTLQAVLDVEGVIADMLRVGRKCIVSFPNVAYHNTRRLLAEEGRSPGACGWLRQKWYNTPDIRFLSIADFEEFCTEKGIQIQRRITIDTAAGTEVFDDPNRNADLAIFVISNQKK